MEFILVKNTKRYGILFSIYRITRKNKYQEVLRYRDGSWWNGGYHTKIFVDGDIIRRFDFQRSGSIHKQQHALLDELKRRAITIIKLLG